MKWNKFPEVLPPENKKVIFLTGSYKFTLPSGAKRSLLLPSIGSWSYAWGWEEYESGRIFIPDRAPTFWCERTNGMPKEIDYHSKSLNSDFGFNFDTDEINTDSLKQ